MVFFKKHVFLVGIATVCVIYMGLYQTEIFDYVSQSIGNITKPGDVWKSGLSYATGQLNNHSEDTANSDGSLRQLTTLPAVLRRHLASNSNKVHELHRSDVSLQSKIPAPRSSQNNVVAQSPIQSNSSLNTQGNSTTTSSIQNWILLKLAESKAPSQLSETTAIPAMTPKPFRFRYQSAATTRVIIHAKLRTGSSFASEFFNQNPAFFYTFEPLVLATKEDREHNSTEWLRKVLACEFRELWDNSWNNPLHSSRSLPGWKRKIFCYKYNQTDSCALADIGLIERNCSLFPAVATKVIRVPDIEFLRPLMESGSKVIHVIRDPRAVVNSRVGMISGRQPKETLLLRIQTNTNWAQSYCKDLANDLKIARAMFRNVTNLDDIPYILVRYEDLVSEPYRELDRMYKTVSLVPDPAVRRWIRDFTDLAAGKTEGKEIRKQDMFNTFRLNATEAIDHWRKFMSWELVRSIQSVCGDVMDLVGYNQLTSPGDLFNGDVSTVNVMSLEYLYMACG